MIDIDWSKAPEGFPIWIEGLNGMFGTGWHRDDGDRWVDQQGSYWPKGADERGNCRIHVAPWSGDGLPPVGTFVRIADDGSLYYGRGESGEVLAHVENCAVVRMSYGLGCFTARYLEPIKTPAQIAAEEREAAIKSMIAACPYPGSNSTAIDCAALYDAGLRFPKGDDQ